MQMLDQNDVAHRELFALGDMLAEYGGPRIALEVAKRGGSKADLMNRIAERARSEPLILAADRLLGLDAARDVVEGYSLTRALRAGMERNWSKAGLEKDVSNVATTITGMAPNGFFVPLGVLARDFNVGSANQAGNFIGAAVGGNYAIDPLRKIAAIARMGATFITGLKTTLSLPRFTSSSAAAWKSEVAAAGEVLEQTAAATLTPKRCPVTMVLSRQALIQGDPALDATIGRHLVRAVMEQVEYDALNGDGTNDAPVGLRSTSGITNVAGGTNGAQIAYSHLADMEKGPAAANAEETDFAGFVVNPSSRRWMRTAPRGTNLSFIWDSADRPLLGHRAAVTNMLPANLTKGTSSGVCSALTYSCDWSQLFVGIYGGGVDVHVDRITLADVGKVRITASVLVGVGVNLPAAFSKMDDALVV
jgi:HK97 family phage major capsid protein